MNDNVNKFFALYDSDPALRERLAQAEAAYPGSLEIREAVAEPGPSHKGQRIC